MIKGIYRTESRFGPVYFREILKTIITENGLEFSDYGGIEGLFAGSSNPEIASIITTDIVVGRKDQIREITVLSKDFT